MAESASYPVAGKPLEDRLRNLNVLLNDVAIVRWLAEKCAVQPWVVAAVGVGWICGFLLWGFTGELVCTVAGLLYPMYASFKALETGDQDEVHQWLRYWATYSFLSLAENVFYRLLAWVPFYHLVRILIVVWLFLPATKGADSVYAWAVAPALRRYSTKIDAAIARSAEEVRDTLGAAAGHAGAAEIRNVLKKAAVCGATYAANDLGMEDLVANELNKAANARFNKATHGKMLVTESPAGARARVSSPIPRMSPGHCEPENKENAAD